MTEDEEKATGRRPPSQAELLRLWHSFHEFVRECGSCQTAAPIDWQYCAQCGLRLATQCPNCGNPLPPAGGRFCPHCGLEVPAPQAQPR